MWMFLIPESLNRRLQEQRREHFENSLVPAAVAWDEDKTKFAEELCILGDTYKTATLFDTPAVFVNETVLGPTKAEVSHDGRYLYCNKILPGGLGLRISQGRRHGEVFFTTDVVVPVMAEVTKSGSPPKVWMSLTPAEILSQRKGIRLATGKIVVGGLGMGWFLQKAAAKPSVTEIVVVERSLTVVNWLLPTIKKRWPHIDGKLKDVVVGDAVEQIGKHGFDTRYLFDIWEEYGAAYRDRAFQHAKKNFRVWGWGDVDVGR